MMQDIDSNPQRHAGKIQSLLGSVLNSRGDSDPELRRAVELRAATHAGRLPEGGQLLPQELGNYVDKVARHAFKVTDADIETLRADGLSDEAIEDAIHVTVLFNIMDRIADSLGFEIPTAEGFSRAADVLLKRGY